MPNMVLLLIETIELDKFIIKWSMNKNETSFILLCSLFAINLSLAIGQDPILEQKLKEHEETYKILEKNLPDLEIYRDLTYNRNGTTTTSYSYGGTKEAIEANKKYYKSFYNLIYKTYYNSFGNGFIIGVMAAILNKSLTKNKNYKYKIILPVISSIFSNIYENKKIGKVPFFDTGELLKSDNLFSNTNINSFGRIITSIGSSMISYLGTDYTLDKIIWATHKTTEPMPATTIKAMD